MLPRLPAGSLDAIDLLYPDPWPKRRQRKRRFVSERTLALFARALRPGGRFRFASDIDDYVGWTLARLLASPDFDWTDAARRRLAQALSRLGPHPLRGQGDHGRADAELSHGCASRILRKPSTRCAVVMLRLRKLCLARSTAASDLP